MGIPEPAGPLWAAVKAVYDPWPADDEGAAAEVAGAWRSGNTVLAQGAAEATRAGDASLAAWRDAAGEQFHSRVGTFAADLGRLQQNVAGRAAQADYYSAELASAKKAIVDTVAKNENAYAQLNNPQLGAAAPAMRTAFVTQIATSLQAMIAEKAAALRAYPADALPAAQFAGDQPAPGPEKINRPLTQAEAAIAREVFGESLDLGPIRITDDGPVADLAGLDGRPRATPGLISFPPGTLSGNVNTPYFRETLVHELTHQWQYQHGATVAFDLLPDALDGEYDYGDVEGLSAALAEGKPFLEFTYEQQGAIVQDYYRLNTSGQIPPGSPYLEYIRQVQAAYPNFDIIHGLFDGPL